MSQRLFPNAEDTVLDKSWGVQLCEPRGVGAMRVLGCCCVLCGLRSVLSGGSVGTGGGALAALGFHSNSREEPGNTSSGRKAAAVRREPRASLAEQAPDTLSV